MKVFSLALGITLAILYTVYCSPTTIIGAAPGATFTVDIIHRDSLKSPFYNHGMTFSQRLTRALQRSFDHATIFKSNSSTYQTQISPYQGEFLVNISLGNPSHQYLLAADTGSDLMWIRCKPCIDCHKDVAPIFDPKLSSTYKALGCKSERCETTSIETNCSSTKTCQFSTSYVDGTYAIGNIATETIKLGGRSLDDIVFGCSFRNGDDSFEEASSGIVGLGGGDFSLVSQIRSLVKTSKFSYCLIPLTVDDHLSLSSKLIFGDISFGSQAVSTPLVPKWPDTFYYITLEGITVGNARFNYSDASNPNKRMHKGNMVLDSGSLLTFLPETLYQNVETAVKENIKNLRTVEDPEKQLSLCYRAKEVKDAPEITMHFEGADVRLVRYNVFIMVSEDIICLAMTPSNSLIPIFGNVAQSNLLIGYDLENKSVSFKRTDCTTLKV